MVIKQKDPKKCPILNCTALQPDCKSSYNGSVSVDSNAPFGIFVVSNFPAGHIDQICLVCANKDEKFGVNIDVD